ncbi:UxaA family hydrolase [Psychrobacillus sp. FJAT-51614]|uniref:UxaA family hydrolase n=1 Tax=Psychrobacillus mangrovi TaxID=3117745 RepID=A0ABU8F3D9_9BACI
MKTIKGYPRKNGTYGVRNHVIVINTVGELAGITNRLADLVPGVVPVVQQGGTSQFPEDAMQTIRTIKGTVGHPNVNAALVLGMGENDFANQIASELNEEHCKVKSLVLNSGTTLDKIFSEGSQWLKEAYEESLLDVRVDIPITELTIGLECGGSDAWSGITANPAIGVCSDLIVEAGATSILAETTEAIGAEHILARRATNNDVAKQFLTIVKNYEQRILDTGEDIRSANPTPGNMVGGLTTLEEKSLGCIKKGGNSVLQQVLKYAEKPATKGFVFMDTPGYDVESVAGLAAGGAQIVLFSTGKGSPTGSPIVPVIKVGTNPKLYEIMSEHIDVNAGTIVEGKNSLQDVGEEIYNLVFDVANGEKTKAENHRNQEFAIWRLAQSI